MKTTLDISDPLLVRAKQHARRTGRSLRALVEGGLRLVLKAEDGQKKYRMPDRSVGNKNDDDLLAALSWNELRDEIYGGR